MNINWTIGFFVVGIPFLALCFFIVVAIRLTQRVLQWQNSRPRTHSSEPTEYTVPSPVIEIGLGVLELMAHGLSFLVGLGIIQIHWTIVVVLTLAMFYRLLLLLRCGMILLAQLAAKQKSS
jgi:hypothetical protein